MTPTTAFTAAVAEHIGPEQAQAIASRQRYCTKHRGYVSTDGGSGRGRQWRCASCTEARRASLLARGSA